jgi:hypothetical protein
MRRTVTVRLNAFVPASLAAVVALVAGCGSTGPFGTGETTRVPRLSFSSPSSAAEAADSEYVIKVSFEKVLVDDTWSLYYVSDATPAKGAAIIQDGPVTARTIKWDTSQMPSGNYYVFGELKSLDGVVTASAPGSILVSHPVVDGNSVPIVRVISPNGGEALTAGTTKEISWSATDDGSGALECAVEVSRDSGATWTEEAADLTTTSYDWVIPADEKAGLGLRVRVTCSDSDGAAASDVSDRAFSVKAG